MDVFLTLRIIFVCLLSEQVEPSNGVKSKAASPLSFEELLLYSWVQFSLEFNTTSERSLKFGNIPDRLLVCVQLPSLQIRSAIARLHVVPRLSRCQLSSHSLILLVSSVPSWVGALCSCRYSCFPQACGTLTFNSCMETYLHFLKEERRQEFKSVSYS